MNSAKIAAFISIGIYVLQCSAASVDACMAAAREMDLLRWTRETGQRRREMMQATSRPTRVISALISFCHQPTKLNILSRVFTRVLVQSCYLLGVVASCPF